MFHPLYKSELLDEMLGYIDEMGEDFYLIKDSKATPTDDLLLLLKEFLQSTFSSIVKSGWRGAFPSIILR